MHGSFCFTSKLGCVLLGSLVLTYEYICVCSLRQKVSRTSVTPLSLPEIGCSTVTVHFPVYL